MKEDCHANLLQLGDHSVDVVLSVPADDVLHLRDGKVAGDGVHRSGRRWERIVVENERRRSAETRELDSHLLSHIGDVGPGEGEYVWHLCEISRILSQVPLVRTAGLR